MSARLLRVLAGALLLGTYVQASGHTAPTARLTGVSTRSEGAGTTVVIETTDPVAYVAAQPDPLTLLVDLRNVARGQVRPGKASGALADLVIESMTDDDGTEIARVRLLLARPIIPQVRSKWNTVIVELGGQIAQRATPATPSDLPAVPGPVSGVAQQKTVPASVHPSGASVLARPASENPGIDALASELLASTKTERPDPVIASSESAATAQRARKPETATEPAPEPRLEIKPEPKAEPKPEPQAEPKAEVKAEVKAAPKAEPQAEPKAEVKAGSQAEPKASGSETRPARQAGPTPGTKPQVQQVQKTAPPVAAEGEKQYTGHLVTFDFFQADLRAVLRTFSDISGLNVVIDPAIPAGTVDVSLREVPWDQALDVILRSNHLGYVLENNVVRISRIEDLAKEEQERQKLVEAQAMGGQLRVFTRTLSYAKAVDLAKLLKDTRVISSRGTALVDERTNTLIINDLPESVTEAESLIGILDRSEPQVEIEARIVQTSTATARALGVQWGVSGRMASELGNTAPVVFPAQSSVSGRLSATQGNPVGAARDIVPAGVNLPAIGATSAVGISMGTLTGSFNLDVALSALEKKGQGKILSQPKVMMQNNFEAEMTQGVQIPIQTVSNNTVTVTFKDAALTLKVKPQITASNTVMMNISLENASPDYSREVNGIPPIDTQRAVTQVLVNDAETMVIGGIMKSQETSATDGVPGLSRIPLLGWLFRRDVSAEDLRELLIFITPRIRR